MPDRQDEISTLNTLISTTIDITAPGFRGGHGAALRPAEPPRLRQLGNWSEFLACQASGTSLPLLRFRRIAMPTAPNPSSIIAQVSGSGTAENERLTIEGLTR